MRTNWFFRRGAWATQTVLAQVVSALAGFGTNILYARHLALDVVGHIAIVNSVSVMMAVLLDRGLGTWMTRSLATTEVRPAIAIRAALRAALAPGVIISVSCGICFFAIDEGWLRGAFILFPVLAFAIWVFQMLLSLFQGLNLAARRAGAISANGLLTLAFTAGAVYLSDSLASIILASALGYLVAAIISTILAGSVFLHQSPINRTPKDFTRSPTRISRAAFATNILVYGLSNADVFIASALLTTSNLGRYQIARRLGQAAVTPLIVLLSVLFGRMARHDDKRVRKIVGQTSLAALGVVLMGAVIMIFLGPALLPIMFGQKYSTIAIPVALLILAGGLQFEKDLFATAHNSRGKFGIPLIANATALVTLTASVLVFSRPVSLATLALILGTAFLSGSLVQAIGKQQETGARLIPPAAICAAVGLWVAILAASRV